jgi:hypothetical protein
VPVGQLYIEFRAHVDQAYADRTGTARDILDSIRRYAAVFQSFDRSEADSRKALFFGRLAAMGNTTAFAFLLELFVRHGEEPGELHAVLSDLESFLVRRMVCQLSTRGYNRFFVELLGRLADAGGTLTSRVREHLLRSTAESSRWPDDAEFFQAWRAVSLFRVLTQTRVRMLLEALERELRSEMTEKLQLDEKLTIEHLLPQHWGTHWPLPPGEQQEEARRTREQLLHTIGNLTLLTRKLNPSVSNGSWENKRKAILEHSLLRLNRVLESWPEWNEQAIQERGRTLFELARKVWPRPAETPPMAAVVEVRT